MKSRTDCLNVNGTIVLIVVYTRLIQGEIKQK